MATDFVKVFNKVFDKDLPNKEVVLIDGVGYEVLISDVRDKETVVDDKQLMFKLGVPINVGSIVDYNDVKWIIIKKQTIIPKSHQSFIMSESNYAISIQTSNGIHCVPALTVEKTSGLGIQQSTNMTLVDGQLKIVIPYNDMTKSVSRNTRLIVKGVAYEVTYVNNITLDGLLILTCRETILKQTDDLINGVADNNNSDIIKGDSVASINSYKTYSIDIDVESWSLSNDNAEINSSTNKSITIRYKTVGNVEIVALGANGMAYKKLVTINSTLF